MHGYAILNAIALALFVGGWLHGVVSSVYYNDSTRLTYAISVIFLVGVWYGFRGHWDRVGWVTKTLPLLGLLGTAIGFSMVLASTGEEFSIKESGVWTALNTTIVGIIGSLWLSFLKEFR